MQLEDPGAAQQPVASQDGITNSQQPSSQDNQLPLHLDELLERISSTQHASHKRN